MNPFAVILPAAGRSVRFGGPRSKLLESLRGKSVIRRTIDAFLQRTDVASVVIATTPGDRSSIASVFSTAKSIEIDPRVRFCDGGDSRADSVLYALRQVPSQIEWVAVHDAARPLISRALIDRALHAALEHGAAIPALPVTATIKQATGPLPCRCERTLARQSLFAVQTPQIMRRQALLDAFASCPVPLEQITDDAQLLELAGQDVWLVAGEEQNLKITTQLDLRMAEALLAVP